MSGFKSRLSYNVSSKQFLVVKEPSSLKADYSLNPGEFHLTLTGGKGLAYALESSTDRSTWSPLSILTNQPGKATWTNHLGLTDPARFLRVREE